MGLLVDHLVQCLFAPLEVRAQNHDMVWGCFYRFRISDPWIHFFPQIQMDESGPNSIHK
jgi:hypothetical protein